MTGGDHQDIALSVYDRDGRIVRAHVMLISHRNRLQLDQLDGNLISRVDVSAL